MPMIVNTTWLLEYLEPKCSHEELVDAFPRLGLEVEQTHELKKELESIRIGFVRRKEPWPVRLGPAFADIGAAGLLAHGGQPEPAQDIAGGMVFARIRRLHPNPVGLARRRLIRPVRLFRMPRSGNHVVHLIRSGWRGHRRQARSHGSFRKAWDAGKWFPSAPPRSSPASWRS